MWLNNKLPSACVLCHRHRLSFCDHRLLSNPIFLLLLILTGRNNILLLLLFLPPSPSPRLPQPTGPGIMVINAAVLLNSAFLFFFFFFFFFFFLEGRSCLTVDSAKPQSKSCKTSVTAPPPKGWARKGSPRAEQHARFPLLSRLHPHQQNSWRTTSFAEALFDCRGTCALHTEWQLGKFVWKLTMDLPQREIVQRPCPDYGCG